MLREITVRVELGPYTLRGREVGHLDVQQAVGAHAHCTVAFTRDPAAVASPVAALRLGDLAGAELRVIFVADGSVESLAFAGRVRAAEIEHLATGAGEVTVTALSDSYVLGEHAGRRYFREHTPGALAAALAVRVAGEIPAAEPRDYVQTGVSSWAFLAQVAAQEGLQLRARWPRTPGAPADEPAEVGRGFADETHTLTWGRELLRLATGLAPVNAGVTGAFYDPAAKHDHRFRGVRPAVEWLDGARPVVAAARSASTADADGGDPGHVDLGGAAGSRARTLAEFRDRLELASARRLGAAVTARGTSVLPALRAGDRIEIRQAPELQSPTGGGADGELADRTGTFGLVSVTHHWTGTLYENAFTATPWADYHPAPEAVAAPAPGAGSVALGLVVDVQDPKRLGRVRVRLAWMGEAEHSAWLRVAGLGGGNGRGLGVLPSVGDEVVVAAVAGDPEHPVVLGGLWNGVDRAAHAPGRQHWVTPAGNTLSFAEGKPGEDREVVELHTRRGSAWVQLAQQGPTGVPTVTVHSEGDLSLEAPNGQVRVTAKSYLAHVAGEHATQVAGKFSVKADGEIGVASAGGLGLAGAGNTTVWAGGTLHTHAGSAHAHSGAPMDLDPGGGGPAPVRPQVPAAPASAWGPRPVPAPGPGRSTEDPVTPTLTQLAERARRASMIVEPPAGEPSPTRLSTSAAPARSAAPTRQGTATATARAGHVLAAEPPRSPALAPDPLGRDRLTAVERQRLGDLCRLGDCSKAQVYRGNGTRNANNLRADVLRVSQGRSVTLGTRIFLGDADRNDFAVLAHEVQHTVQYQRWGAATYYTRALGERFDELRGVDPYNYRVDGRRFDAYGMEQQGQIVQDYVRGFPGARSIPGAPRVGP